MNRRASLPGADELFRATGPAATPATARPRPVEAVPDPADEAAAPAPKGTPKASGRVGHDEKITVYLTPQELLDLEQARLRLRAEFGIAVDRGRIVRESVADALKALHAQGPDAPIVRRLS